MKKLIIGLSLIISFITASSFTGYKDTLPNHSVLKTFQLEFKNATNVSWSEERGVALAKFNLDNSRVLAFFSPEGLLLGTTRSILLNQLPLLPLKELRNRFQDGLFYDVSEYTIDHELYYVLTVETSTKKLEVKLLPSGESYIRKSKRINTETAP